MRHRHWSSLHFFHAAAKKKVPSQRRIAMAVISDMTKARSTFTWCLWFCLMFFQKLKTLLTLYCEMIWYFWCHYNISFMMTMLSKTRKNYALQKNLRFERLVSCAISFSAPHSPVATVFLWDRHKVAAIILTILHETIAHNLVILCPYTMSQCSTKILHASNVDLPITCNR